MTGIVVGGRNFNRFGRWAMPGEMSKGSLAAVGKATEIMPWYAPRALTAKPAPACVRLP